MFRAMKCIDVKKFVYLIIFHIQPISMISIQVSDLMNTGHGRGNKCYIQKLEKYSDQCQGHITSACNIFVRKRILIMPYSSMTNVYFV